MEDTALLKASDFLSEDDPLLTFILVNLRNAMVNRANQLAGQYGFTLRQLLVIVYIMRHEDEVVTQKQLEDTMHLSNPTITVLIQNMMKKGFIRRVKVPEDGRKYRLLLTDKARENYDQCCRVMEQSEKEVYAGVTEEEKQLLLSVFQKIEKNLGYSSLT